MTERAFYQREFLNNSDEGLAAVEAKVEATDVYDRGGSPKSASIDASFKISDCNRVVELSFYINSGESSDEMNALVKISRLRLALAAFERALVAEIAKMKKAIA